MNSTLSSQNFDEFLSSYSWKQAGKIARLFQRINSCVQSECVKNLVITGPDISCEDIEEVWGKTDFCEKFKGPRPSNFANILGNHVTDRSEHEDSLKKYRDALKNYKKTSLESQPVSKLESFSGKPLFLGFPRYEAKSQPVSKPELFSGKPLFLTSARDEYKYRSSGYNSKYDRNKKTSLESQPISKPESFSGKPLFLTPLRDEYKYRSSGYNSKYDRKVPAGVYRSNSRSRRSNNSQ